MGSNSQTFTNQLPTSRLGQRHETRESFNAAVSLRPCKSKQFSLVVVTEPHCRRILLGMKHRGFGKGMFNSFGGKLSEGETDVQCASRELAEECGISVPASTMKHLKVGVLHFTFEDDPDEMLVHVFRLDISCSSQKGSHEYFRVDPQCIRGCEEISPKWFEDWRAIPLDNMFADDSVWLTRLLSIGVEQQVWFDGFFHFKPGGQAVNSVQDYYMSFKIKTQDRALRNANGLSLKKRLFHALRSNKIRSPSVKEFEESYAFTNAVRSAFGKNEIDVVIDVAGGHGAISALMLVTTSANEAVVIDPAKVGNGGVEKAFGPYYSGKIIRYRHECLRTGLPEELKLQLGKTSRRRILVIACHACQHLSDETVRIAITFGVHVAVMPCCQKDQSPGSSWKAASKNLSIPVETVMDILLAGKAMSWDIGASYDVRLRTIDRGITPQNRIIVCRAKDDNIASTTLTVERAHEKLQKVYKKAHSNSQREKSRNGTKVTRISYQCLASGALGFASCFLVMCLYQRK